MQFIDRWWPFQWPWWLIPRLQLLKYPYWLLKYILWFCRHWSVRNLWKLGIFEIPTPNGDEFEGPYEVGVKVYWYPFQPIPNVRSFEVELKAFDPIFAMFGIRRRFDPAIKFKKHTNNKYNRYMEHCLKRLFFALDNPTLYFRISMSLIKHSRVFFARQLMLTEPKWHRDMKYWQVNKIWREYRGITRDELRRIEYHRVFIPKPNGKKRPLGVPSVAWRIYLGLFNKFLLKFVKGKVNRNQHAYQPNKSTITVWRQILDEIVEKRNIYSFDLVKYFDKVKLSSCVKAMVEVYKVPEVYAKYLWYIHLSLPSNIRESIYEPLSPYRQQVDNWSKQLRQSVRSAQLTRRHTIREFRKVYSLPWKKGSLHWPFWKVFKHLPYLEEQVWSQDSSFRLFDPSVSWWLRQEKLRNKVLFPTWLDEIGIPQGAPISPLMSILVQDLNYFKRIEKQGASIVQYSDDGVCASDDDNWTPKLTVEEDGIYHSEEKSFWVKRKGVWLKPLDFVGLRYDGERDCIIANTRSGSVLELKDVDGLTRLLAFRDLLPYYGGSPEHDTKSIVKDPDSYKEEEDREGFKTSESWRWIWKEKRMASSEILKHWSFGLLQARLYSGSWELENYDQDFRLTATKGSLVSMHYKQIRKEGWNVFTSTSWAFPILISDLGESRRKSLRRWRQKSIINNENI